MRVSIDLLFYAAGARHFVLTRPGGSCAVAPTKPPAALRGGGDTSAKSAGLSASTICAAVVLSWISIATLVFSLNEGWPIAQSLFYAVDTGMSIGFGAVAENKASTKLFTILHVLLGASAVGGAIALFAEAMVAESSRVAACEYSRMALLGAFEAADADAPA